MVAINVQKKRNHITVVPFLPSGYQDSNLGPPAPKAGALTGLRYIPNNFKCFVFQKRCKDTAYF